MRRHRRHGDAGCARRSRRSSHRRSCSREQRDDDRPVELVLRRSAPSPSRGAAPRARRTRTPSIVTIGGTARAGDAVVAAVGPRRRVAWLEVHLPPPRAAGARGSRGCARGSTNACGGELGAGDRSTRCGRPTVRRVRVRPCRRPPSGCSRRHRRGRVCRRPTNRSSASPPESHQSSVIPLTVAGFLSAAVGGLGAVVTRRGLCPDFLGFRLTREAVSGKLQACHSGWIAVLRTGSVTRSEGCSPPSDAVRRPRPRTRTLDCRTICCASRGTGRARRRGLRFVGARGGASTGRGRGRVRRTRSAGCRGRPACHGRTCGSGSARRVVRAAAGHRCGVAERSGVDRDAVELIAGARVPGFDEELSAVEGEFLERAKRGDHKTLARLTQHFRLCARADGSKPEQPDGVTVAEVGTGVLRRTSPCQDSRPSRALEPFTRPPRRRRSTLAQRQAEGLMRICEIALAPGDRRRRCPTRRVLSHPGTHSTRRIR